MYHCLINKGENLDKNVRQQVRSLRQKVRQEPTPRKKTMCRLPSLPIPLSLTLSIQVVELVHPELANVPKAQIKAKLATLLKAKDENIAVFGLKTKFGGGRSTGFACVYDSTDLRKKYDSKKELRRVSPCLFLYYIGRLSCERQGHKKDEKGN